MGRKSRKVRDGVAEHLLDPSRLKQQKSALLNYLNSEISGLPFQRLLTGLRLEVTLSGLDTRRHAALELVLHLYLTQSQSTSAANGVLASWDAARILDLATRLISLENLTTQFIPANKHSSIAVQQVTARRKLERMGIRQQTYPDIEHEVNLRILGSPRVSKLLQAVCGTDYAEVKQFRDAVVRLQEQKLNTMQDLALGDVRVEVIDLAHGPFILAQNEIAKASGLPLQSVQRICELFEAKVEACSSAYAAFDSWVANPNKLFGSLYLKGQMVFVLTAGEIGGDHVRKHFESFLADTKHWNDYERWRAKTTEMLAQETFESILRNWKHTPNLVFVGDSKSGKLLNKDFKLVPSDAITYEVDHLTHNDSICLCIDAKAGSVTGSNTATSARDLSKALKGTFSSGDEQTLRLSKLIRENSGFWSSRKWSNFAFISEVYSIVVTLDEIGGLATQSNELIAEGILNKENLLWSISIHDLLVMKKIAVTDVEFVSYLRLRCSLEFWQKYAALEELDFFAAFLEGKVSRFFDPKKIIKNHPNFLESGISTNRTRKVPKYTFFDDQLAKFNVILQPTIHPGKSVPLNDLRNRLPELWSKVVEELEKKCPEESFLAQAEICGFDSATWQDLDFHFKTLVERFEADRQTHSATLTIFSYEHSMTVVFVIGNEDRLSETVSEYLKERCYFSKSRLGLGLVFGEDFEISDLTLQDKIWVEDSDLAQTVKLRGFYRSPAAIPPYARLKKKKHGKKPKRKLR